MSMDINFGRVVIYNKEFLYKKSPDPFYRVVLQGHTKYFNCCITTTTWLVATKLGKVVTYCKKLQSI